MYQCGKRGISGCAFILVSFWGISGGSAGAQPGSVGTVVAFFLEVLYHHRVNHYHRGSVSSRASPYHYHGEGGSRN